MNPQELAEWAHDSLQRRQFGELYALVITDGSPALVLAYTQKCMRIERQYPETIAGYFEGAQNRTPKVSVEDLRGAIEATLAEAA